MKTKLVIALALVVVTIAAAQTYTNGLLSPRLPITDEQVSQIRLLRFALARTNEPVAQFATNFLTVELTAGAKNMLANLKGTIQQRIAVCEDENKLLQIQAILDAP